MKPLIFTSIINAVLAYAGYSVTPKDLDTGHWLLTDSTLSLIGDFGAVLPKPKTDTAVAPVAGTASDTADGSAIPAEFADLAKRRPEEYQAVVNAFLKAYDEGRVVAMKDVVYSDYRIVKY